MVNETREAAAGVTVPQRRRKRRARPAKRLRTWLGRARAEVWPAQPEDPAPPPGRTFLVPHALPLALYTLLTLIVTFPLVLHFGTRIVSDGGDALMNYWGYWWVRKALESGQNPYVTPYVYAPYGAPLYLHTLNPLNGLIGLPFQMLFGLTPAYNIVTCLSLILAAYFGYLLVAHVSGSRYAGFAGGVVYAFGAYHLTHLLGHANLLSSEWLPAYLLCLLRACEGSGRRRTRYALLALLALICLLLTDWLYVVFAVLLTLIVACWYAATRRSIAPLVVAAAIGGVWGLVALPLALATAAEVRSGITALPDISAMRIYSVDPLALIAPSTRHWVFNLLGGKARYPWEVPPIEGDIFLGVVPLVLAGFGAWAVWRRAALWLLIAGVFLVLALGPYLHINGVWRFGESRWTIPLPYLALVHLPGLSVVRTPVRLVLGVTLALAVLSGLGLVGLARRWPRLGAGRARGALVGLVVALLLAEQLTIPVPLQATEAPAFYHQLATSPEQGTILELPISYKRALSDYYQTVHERPIFAGYIARRLAYPVRRIIPSPLLPGPGSDIFVRPATPNLGPWSLAFCNVRWIVIYRDDPGFDDAVTRFVELYADGPAIYDDGAMAVYRPRPPEGIATGLAVGPGWYEQEQLADAKTNIRWFDAAASIYAWHFGSPAQQYALRFDAWSFHEPRRLEVRVDGRVVGQWRVVETQRFDIPLTLAEGEHTIELRALDPPISPVSVGLPGKDTRALAFAISNVALAR